MGVGLRGSGFRFTWFRVKVIRCRVQGLGCRWFRWFRV